ncbi:MAG: hypothetical protein OT477_20925 [Chloroflexi bacterium]|nr:hypothetical protein [Chloroflexota bacterium]
MSQPAELPPTPHTAAPYRSFIVRCWWADTAETRRRFVVQDVATGEQYNFAEIDLLLDFLGQEMAPTSFGQLDKNSP